MSAVRKKMLCINAIAHVQPNVLACFLSGAEGILEKLGSSRLPNQYDRDFYDTWVNKWNFSNEMIDHAITLSHGKTSPMSYMNKVLANWHDQKITTLDKAKKSDTTLPKEKKFTKFSYSDEELSRVISNLNWAKE